MKEKICAAVLGGDERQSRLACILADSGIVTHVYGTDSGFCSENSGADMTGVERYASAVEAVRGADAVIFPLPAVKNGEFLNEKSSSQISVTEILDNVPLGAYVFAGKADSGFEELACARGLRFFDYYRSEPLTVKNAHLTAEGALYIFMTEKKISVLGSKILITGSGRVAKCTARVFGALGAAVTVMARNKGELAWAEIMGYGTADLEKRSERMTALSGGHDAIINTIPVTFITGCNLAAVPEGTLYIELASAPYGMDAAEAGAYGVKMIKAPSLPGKYAPESAARAIAEVIFEKMKSTNNVNTERSK